MSLPIHFIKTSPAEVTLWKLVTWETDICTFRKVYPHALYWESLSNYFPIMFFKILWPSIQAIGHSLWIHIQSCLCSFLFSSKINNQLHYSKFCLLETSPVNTVLQGCLRRDACIPYRTIYTQTFVFPSWVNNYKELPYEAIGTGQERKGNIAELGAMSIWAISWCRVLVPSGLPSTWSPVYQFH